MNPTARTTLKCGLVGAGPWATMFHAPAISGGDETELVGVWARRPEAAAELARAHGAEAVGSFDELLERCDAVAFAVPPAVQAELAIRAARRGRTLLLDKPIAADLDTAERLAAEVADYGVGSVVLLTMRFNGAIRRFITEARARPWASARLRNVSGAFLDGPFSNSPWRHERGVLLDVGPHAFDLLDAVCGPIVHLKASRDSDEDPGEVTLTCEHEAGTRSVAVLSGTATSDVGGRIELSGGDGDGDDVSLDVWSVDNHDVHANVRRALVDAAAGMNVECDVHRGAMLQRLIDQAERQLEASR
ncbi:Gfo/Idh/MocA family protein [Desertimonas flava]|uniref:Gfo/Idh/MocA family protein n=1 Tax=Desertimonas flava TaxID=2064846 RepID=UPI000E357B38|nr:Gfo/Idh/MocA family oxidoreductase [Desertimonas flava]